MNKNFFALMRVYVIGLLMTCVIGQPVVMCAANPKPPVASDKKGIASAKNTIIAFALAAGYSVYELHAAYKKAQKDEKKQALLERQKNPEQKEDIPLKITSFWKFFCDPVLRTKYLKPTPFLAAIAGVGVGVLLDYKNAPEKPLAAESPKPSTSAPQPIHTGSSAPKPAQPRVTPASGGGANGVTAPLLSVADEVRLKEEAARQKAEAARQKAEAEKRKKEEEARKKQVLIAAFQKNATPPVAKAGKMLTTKDFKTTPDKLVAAYNKYTKDVRTAVQGNLQQYVTAYVGALGYEIEQLGIAHISTETNAFVTANRTNQYIAGQKAHDNWKPALTGKQLTEKIKKSECACLYANDLRDLLEAPRQQLGEVKNQYKQAAMSYCFAYAQNLIVGEQYNRSKIGLSLYLKDKLGLFWELHDIQNLQSLQDYETRRKDFIDAKIAAVENKAMADLASSRAARDKELREVLKTSLIRVLMVEEDGGKYFQDQYLTAEYGTRFVQYLQAMDALMYPLGGWNTHDPRAQEVRDTLKYMMRNLQGTFYPWPIGDSIKPSDDSIDRFCNIFMTHICCSPERINFDYAQVFNHIELPTGLRFITESLIPAFVRFNSETLLTEDGQNIENMQRRRLAAALMRRANDENRKTNGQDAVIDDIEPDASFEEITEKLNFYSNRFGISFCTVRSATHPVGFNLSGKKYVYKGDGWYTDTLMWSSRLPEVGDAS